MPSRRVSLATAIAIGLLAGVGYPSLDLALACREPASEACVWARAFLPLTRWVSLGLIGSVVTGLVYAVLRWPRQAKRKDEAP